MPMNFPDLDSLKHRAAIQKFRQPNDGENEAQYRQAFAEYMEPIDFVEAQEIRNKVGWDRFTDKQNVKMLEQKVGAGNLLRMLTYLDNGR